MIPLCLDDVAAAAGGQLIGDPDPRSTVTGPVVVDSRLCRSGSLFVCVPGEHVDGHDFASAAVEAGAVAVLAARPVGVPAVLVDDTALALGRLAAKVLSLVPSCRVVGVTGSSGKTSTKDLLAQVLQRFGETESPQSSFNNEIGLPLTVLRITETTRTLVCEYSARRVGHIRYLCGIARPQLAIVLNVGDAHLGEFGSRAAIAEAKGELVEALPPEGVAVLNADDPLVRAMADRTPARTVTFGTGDDADVRVDDLQVDDLARPAFRLVTPAGSEQVRLQLHGAHHAGNAAAVAAAALALGMPFVDVVTGLEAAVARSAHRMDVRPRRDGLLVIDDAYNANPDSVSAAVLALAKLGRGRRGRTWAVLGEMRELGADSAAMHASTGAEAARAGVDEVVAVGAGAPLAEGAQGVPGWTGRARTVDDADAAVRLLRREVSAEDVVLVKASNTIQLWRVADALLADLPAGATA